MKKATVILSMVLILILSFGTVTAFASGVEFEEIPYTYDNEYEYSYKANEICTKEMFITIPTGFSYMAYDEKDEKFSYYLTDQYAIHIFYENNFFIPDGINKLSEEEIKSAFTFLYIKSDVIFTSIEKTKVNGISSYVLKGKEDIGIDKGELYSSFVAYNMATKEKVYFICFYDLNDNFSMFDDVQKTMESVAINGSYFDGDSQELNCDFDSFKSFRETARTFAESYIEDTNWADGHFYMEPKAMFFAGVAVIGLICILVFTVIVLGVKNSKYKRKNKEYEAHLDSLMQENENNFVSNTQPIQSTNGEV